MGESPSSPKAVCSENRLTEQGMLSSPQARPCLPRDAASCSDLISYLLFTSTFTSALIDIGYNDASRRIDEIESFLYSSDENK